MNWRLKCLRAIDKLDRLGPSGVYSLLTQGRMDKSGDFTDGANLSQQGANFIMLAIGYEFDNKTRQWCKWI